MPEKHFVKNLFQNLVHIIKDTAKIVEQDAVYGARIGKVKIKEMQYEQKKLQKLIEIGRRTYFLYKKGEIKDSQLKDLCKQMFMLEKTSKTYHNMVQEYKKNIKL
jgi:hypothetical protein